MAEPPKTPAARQQRYWDYWGTQVTSFDLSTPHRELEVTAESVVETADAAPPPTGATWSLLRSEAVTDAHVEVLVPSAEGNERLAMHAVGDMVAGLGLAPDRLDRLRTAVAEATMNAMEHGSRYDAGSPVTVRVLATADAVRAANGIV